LIRRGMVRPARVRRAVKRGYEVIKRVAGEGRLEVETVGETIGSPHRQAREPRCVALVGGSSRTSRTSCRDRGVQRGARLGPLARQGKKRRLGLLDGKFRIPDDFNKPLAEEVIAGFEGHRR
jgi:hypothetical protein